MAIKDKLEEVSAELVTAALYANGYTSYMPWAESIGFQTAASAYRKQENRSSLAEDFLLNTRNERNDVENVYSILSYLDDRGMVMVSMNGHEDISEYKLISLPEGIPLDIALGDAIIRRRSHRSYTGDACELTYLASIIRSGFGITTNATVRLVSEGTVNYQFRTVPSAGGLYPIELYIAVLNVNTLNRGIYRYQPLYDSLIQTGDAAQLEELLKAVVVPDEIISCSYANAIFLLVASPWKTMRKYGNRGLRFVFHESGAISQNIHLAVTALGLGSVDCASICENEMHDVLQLDGHFKSVLHAIIVGASG